MKALSVHTYLGGMQVGVSKGADVLGSMESWNMAFKARAGHGFT